nr:MAG TPA: hypothetical protein [Caudoviricetes sp.]
MVRLLTINKTLPLPIGRGGFLFYPKIYYNQ